MIYKILSETSEIDFFKICKNYYTTSTDQQITINSNNYRIITVDKILLKDFK